MGKEKDTIRYLNNELSDEELKEFMKTDEYKLLQKTDASIQKFSPPEFNVEGGLEKLKSTRKITDQKSVREPGRVIKMQNFTQGAWFRVAAVITVLAVSLLYFLSGTVTVLSTSSGERLSFYLPDSSYVIMNAGTEISYKPSLWNENRSLSLKGEALFKVKKGSEFKVQTASGTVSVLGTSFNVTERDGYFNAACYEGRVQVEYLSENHILNASDSYVYFNGKGKLEKLKINDEPSWITMESDFNEVPVYRVFNEISVQFGVEVVFEGIEKDRLITCSFSHDDLKVALEVVSGTLGAHYEIEGSKIIITKSGS